MTAAVVGNARRPVAAGINYNISNVIFPYFKSVC